LLEFDFAGLFFPSAVLEQGGVLVESWVEFEAKV
jgi:hypothetical protein